MILADYKRVLSCTLQLLHLKVHHVITLNQFECTMSISQKYYCTLSLGYVSQSAYLTLTCFIQLKYL